ncbi:hypothetical protein KAR48_09535 [bacterium]|nr:hypothetical protein [bacterium]
MKQLLTIILALFFNFASTVLAQTCGPNCPACSGNVDGIIVPAKSISLQGLFIPTGEDEFGVMGLRYGLLDWMDIGIGFTFKAQKLIWNARLQPLKQNKDNWQPGIILGTGSIRTGSGDQSIYLNLLKSKEFSENFAIGISAGAASLVSDLEKIYGIANISLSFQEKFTAFVNFDGVSFHQGVTWNVNDWFNVGFMLLESKDPAITVNIIKSLFNAKTPDSP